MIDSYFPEAAFFTEFERFDRHVERLKREGTSIDFVSVCSPNYLHDAHIRFGLRHGADVICEKPLVLNPWNIDGLTEIEKETGKSIYNILQLRLHPAVLELKKRVDEAQEDEIFDIDLTYITSRGNWYFTSWKGDESKSGGVATNIGVHFFDMLLWIFGDLLESEVHVRTHDRAAGFLRLKRARVKWFLSINASTLPKSVAEEGKRTYRSIVIAGDEFEFSGGFEDLHTRSYQGVLDGNGFRAAEAIPSISVVREVRSAEVVTKSDKMHELASLPLEKHPFESSK